MNRKRGVIFWWSAKCGCTTVKSIMLESMVRDFLVGRVTVDEDSVRASLSRLLYLKQGRDGSRLDACVSEFMARNYVHSVHCMIAGPSFRIPLREASGMTNVLFLRDPLQRFVSGVVDKHIEGNFSSLYRPASFFDATKKIAHLESHHFAPQSSEAFLPDLKYDRVFDIASIDFGYLSEILGMKVAPRVLHKKRDYTMPCEPDLARMDYYGLAALKASGKMPNYRCFYDEESLANVRKYYDGDFELIRRWLPGEAS